MRIDKYLYKKGLAQSRSQAQALIKAGAVSLVLANKTSESKVLTIEKPSYWIGEDDEVTVAPTTVTQYVSRAGHKLEAALAKVDLPWRTMIALDIGQSTGGFTDCLLQKGIGHVVGLDVGKAQLHASLNNHSQVSVYEGVNARYFPADIISQHAKQGFDLVVMDVSFISQILIHETIRKSLKPKGLFIGLVKPQFEVGKEHIGKGGLVTKNASYALIQERICESLKNNNFTIQHYFPSPITGGDGNKEFLVIAKYHIE